MIQDISMFYFSATGTTRKVVLTVANEIVNRAEEMKLKNCFDVTLPFNREKPVRFSKDELVIVGLPVYAGRVPNLLIKYLKTIESNGATAVPIVVYGNRNYDDALVELKDILDSCGFNVIAGAAFIGEHSFSKILAKARPDSKDFEIMINFAHVIIEKLRSPIFDEPLYIKGEVPYRDHYMPRNKANETVDFRKIKPKTSESCIDCKICSEECSMGSIDYQNVTVISGICIKCCACIKKCPVQAKYFDDMNYIRHKNELEIEFQERKEPDLFI